MLKLHNTLSGKLEEVKPIDNQNVRIYSCGPTVYDRAHIGNLASYIFADTLRRSLVVLGFPATQAMNITDVEDKIILRSKETYPELKPMAALQELTSQYTILFFKDMEKVGNSINGVTFIRATDHIGAMKQLVIRLHEEGFAYITHDGVYFSIEAYKKSGKVYGQLTEVNSDNTSRERIQNDEYDKESAHDFVLWKAQKENEPAWEFELAGKKLSGRPGWHIECSAMSRHVLGQPFDIHTGGIDLVFPHHENEIAQSTAGEENSMLASIFAHNEHLLVDGKKMSKSLNNFYTLDDVIANKFDPLAFRLLVLQSHYRNQAHFSWDNLGAAQNRLYSYQRMADLLFQAHSHDTTSLTGIDFGSCEQKIMKYISDDLNTPEVLSTISILAHEAESLFLGESQVHNLKKILELIDQTLGLRLTERTDITAGQKSIIQERELARHDKDWAASDELRNQLKMQGIGVRDTEHGTVWYRENVL